MTALPITHFYVTCSLFSSQHIQKMAAALRHPSVCLDGRVTLFSPLWASVRVKLGAVMLSATGMHVVILGCSTEVLF